MYAAPIFAISGFTATLIFFIYMFYSSRHKERMALIETGKDASIFRELSSQINSLKYGLVVLAAGIGIFMGNFLSKAGFPEPVAYFSMVFIMGGLALIGFYLYARKEGQEE